MCGLAGDRSGSGIAPPRVNATVRSRPSGPRSTRDGLGGTFRLTRRHAAALEAHLSPVASREERRPGFLRRMRAARVCHENRMGCDESVRNARSECRNRGSSVVMPPPHGMARRDGRARAAAQGRAHRRCVRRRVPTCRSPNAMDSGAADAWPAGVRTDVPAVTRGRWSSDGAAAPQRHTGRVRGRHQRVAYERQRSGQRDGPIAILTGARPVA